jgi:hypothetical protein
MKRDDLSDPRRAVSERLPVDADWLADRKRQRHRVVAEFIAMHRPRVGSDRHQHRPERCQR